MSFAADYDLAAFSSRRAFYAGASLALDFTKNRYRVGSGIRSTSVFASLPGLTVSRSSVGYAERQDGTLVQFPANTARITDKGLLVEEARTNLLPNSQTLGTGAWSNNSASVSSDVIAAPDGTLTADKIVENTATSAHFEAQTLTLAASTTYTISVYAKAGERTRFAIAGAGGAWGSFSQATFDLATGTTVGVSGAFTSQSITALANGWYRCVVIGTSAAVPTNAQAAQLALVNTGTSTSYTGDGVSGAYFWGAQLEAGAFPTSYIPTTSASATRAADSVSIAGLSGLSAATVRAKVLEAAFVTGASPYFFSLNDGGSTNIAIIRRTSASDIAASATPSGSVSASAAFTAGGTTASAMSYAANVIRVAANGGAATSDTAAYTPATYTQLNLGNRPDALRALNGYLQQLVIWQGVSDAAITQARSVP